MTEKPGKRRLYGLWITMMIYISGRVTVWPYLEGHRFAQEIAIFGLMTLAYLLGFAGGCSRGSTTPGREKPQADH
ncbi:hypothetical protein ACFYXF_48565 [Streptomyces sp. NPDC002680]|uniref:hypothetical protein n=1 Tax=Streptomyces sp. NPDC002680 TaxID=3364659 RepID=UPI0036B71472